MTVYGHVNTGRTHGTENAQDRFGIIAFQKLILQFVHRFRHGNTQPYVVIRDVVIPVEREDRFFAVRFDISVIQNSARYKVGGLNDVVEQIERVNKLFDQLGVEAQFVKRFHKRGIKSIPDLVQRKIVVFLAGDVEKLPLLAVLILMVNIPNDI